VALFELAVLELREAQRLEHEHENPARVSPHTRARAAARRRRDMVGVNCVCVSTRSGSGLMDRHACGGIRFSKNATALLDSAMSLSGSEVDLSSRLESRILMLRDEIALKREIDAWRSLREVFFLGAF
jgi:hypothetical protein